MIIAINPDHGPANDRSAPRWAALLEHAGHEVRWVNVYHADVLDQLRGCHGFMWRHGHTRGMWHIARRLLPVIERELDLAVYPDQDTCWHYDDKIAQAHLFEAVGIPAPRTWVWFDERAARDWVATAEFPVVLKLWSGACGQNVRLVRSYGEAQRWITRLFSGGAHDVSDESVRSLRWKRRVKSAARMLLQGQMPSPPSSGWDLHKNYALFQEFLPDNPFDTRITVIGNRAFGFRRMNRPGDFRASGSGRIDYDPAGVDLKAVRLGLEVAERIRTQSVALDVLRREEERLVGEISYTYASWAIHSCPGHWELRGEPASAELLWKDGQMWPEEAQIADFLARLERHGDGKAGVGNPRAYHQRAPTSV